MFEILTLLGLAVAPAIYLAIVIYGYDKYDREPKTILFFAFILGGLSTIPAVAMETAWVGMGYDGSSSIYAMLFFSVIVIGFSEEISKFIMVRLHAYKNPAFSEPFDGIVYGAFVALGFATLENILYVMQYGYGTGVMRMFTAVPAHYAFGVIMGYYVGKAKFNMKYSVFLMAVGVLFATVLHGAYDFFILQEDYPGLAIFTFVILILSWRLSKRAIRSMQKGSKFRFHKRNEFV